jgi:hypothetical protein
MIPVAVSVPDQTNIQISMETSNWAFGKIVGKPR